MKIVIIDDHALVRQGLISILSLEDNIDIVGEGKNVEEGLSIILKYKPDISLVDLRLKNENGLNIIKKAKDMNIKSKFVVLTSSANQRDFIEAEKCNVDGYILKESFPEELLYGINIINRGRKYYDPILLEYKMAKTKKEAFENLTSRENEVLLLLGKGMTNKEISTKLFITENTVKKHVGSILGKLDLHDRTQAALYANNEIM